MQTTTPEQLITFQAHSAKMLIRVSEIAIKKQIHMVCELTGYKESDLSLIVHWNINGENFYPGGDEWHCYSWFSIVEIDKWFRNVNVALDLLEVESEAA
ncbi:hypothetical protein ACSVJ5_002890 [Vibrio vulnificus]